MKEFLEAFAITSVFIFVGYFLFGDVGKVQLETEAIKMDMNMSGMDHSNMKM
jgi:hypothetical protein